MNSQDCISFTSIIVIMVEWSPLYLNCKKNSGLVPKARKIIKSVKSKCVICRMMEGRTEDQRMGQVMEERLKPIPAFYYTALDLFGPFTIRDAVKRRTHGKAFGVIFT